MRLVFAGSPPAALPTLAGLAAEHDVLAVMTRPDAIRGRSRKLEPSAVGAWAAGRGVPLLKPTDRSDVAPMLESLGPIDAAIVVAYGMIIPVDALDIPRLGFLNVHFSLLPRWRGAAPVERALMAGDPMTGVSIIRMDAGLDTGPVLNAQAVDIPPEETGGELTSRLAQTGARLMTVSLRDYALGRIEPIPQSDAGATYASKLTPADRVLSPTIETVDALNLIRALAPKPGARALIAGRAVNVLGAAASDRTLPQGRFEVVDGRPLLGFADGALEMTLVQTPGKAVVGGPSWANGWRSGPAPFG